MPKLLDQLEDSRRTAYVVRRCIEEHATQAVVALEMGVGQSTVSRILSQARSEMREAYLLPLEDARALRLQQLETIIAEAMASYRRSVEIADDPEFVTMGTVKGANGTVTPMKSIKTERAKPHDIKALNTARAAIMAAAVIEGLCGAGKAVAEAPLAPVAPPHPLDLMTPTEKAKALIGAFKSIIERGEAAEAAQGKVRRQPVVNSPQPTIVSSGASEAQDTRLLGSGLSSPDPAVSPGATTIPPVAGSDTYDDGYPLAIVTPIAPRRNRGGDARINPDSNENGGWEPPTELPPLPQQLALSRSR